MILIDAVRRHNAPYARNGIDARIPADDAAGIEHGITSHLYPVAKHCAELLTAGLDELAPVFHNDRRTVALNV